MKPILVIFKKEFRSLFFSPAFMIICGLITTFLSFVYALSLSQFRTALSGPMFGMMGGGGGEQMSIHHAVFIRHLILLNLLLIVFTPAITMWLLSEEKKMRTMDLLLTLPITSVQIVVGKYLAALAAVGMIVGLALTYPIATGLFANFNWQTLLVAYSGIFLVGGVYAATNLFCSSLTESAIISFFLSVFFNFLVWFIGMGAEVVDGAQARAVFEHISLNSHLSSMVVGTVRSSSLIFYASVIFLFGFLSERVVESARWR